MIQQELIVFDGGTIIDGKHDSPIQNKSLIIEGGIINAIVDRNEMSKWAHKADRIYDLSGHSILPGFIDTHTHIQLSGKQPEIRLFKESVPKKTLRAAHNARKTIEAGFTTIRDLGAEYLIDLGVRDAISYLCA